MRQICYDLEPRLRLHMRSGGEPGTRSEFQTVVMTARVRGLAAAFSSLMGRSMTEGGVSSLKDQTVAGTAMELPVVVISARVSVVALFPVLNAVL